MIILSNNPSFYLSIIYSFICQFIIYPSSANPLSIYPSILSIQSTAIREDSVEEIEMYTYIQIYRYIYIYHVDEENVRFVSEQNTFEYLQ